MSTKIDIRVENHCCTLNVSPFNNLHKYYSHCLRLSMVISKNNCLKLFIILQVQDNNNIREIPQVKSGKGKMYSDLMLTSRRGRRLINLR